MRKVLVYALCSSLLLVACGGKEEVTQSEDMKAPHVEAPEDRSPQVEPPQVNPPQVEPPQVNPPKVEPPKVTPPKVTPPKVNIPDVSIDTDDRQITMQVPDQLLFDFDKSDLRPESKEVLDKIAEALEEYDGADVYIHGHTDNVGDSQYNMELSKKRAEAVRGYLEEKGALAKVRVETKGYGDTKPIAPNDSKENQQKNRRVEIIIEPKTEGADH